MTRWVDSEGLFWTDPVKAKPTQQAAARGGPRVLPPVPETGWQRPGDMPSLASAKFIALDTETYDPTIKTLGPGVRRGGAIVGVSIATDNGFKAYYPIRHHPPGAASFDKNIRTEENFDPKIVMRWLKRELARPHQVKVGANLLYDLDYLGAEGVEVAGDLWDIQLAEPLLDENARSYSLETIAQTHLGEGKVEDELTKWGERAWGKGSVKDNLWRTPAQLVGPYAEGDTALPLRIMEHQRRALMLQEGLFDLFWGIEAKLTPMLLAMRQRGIRVDVAEAEKVAELLKKRYVELNKELNKLAGRPIDVWTPESIARAFDAQSIIYPRTKRGAPSFRKAWLKNHPSPLAKMIVEARGCDKMRNPFVEGYILGHHLNGRLHCLFHQLRSDEYGTVSGRFSSSDPNLQNIPTRDPVFGPMLRKLFLPDEGELYNARDWSQIEYRLIVHYAALMSLPKADWAVNAYNTDPKTDFHEMVGKISKLPRADAKNLNFGIAYGEGKDKIAADLGRELAEAEAIIAQYDRECPFVRKLSYRCSDRAKTKGEIKTLLGRRRRFAQWEDQEGNLFSEKAPGRRRAFTHAAMNALIQGSAADIMKAAMVKIWQSGVCSVLGAPLLTVHDELGLSKPKTKAGNEAMKELTNIMQTVVTLKVPLVAEGKEGRNWKEAK